MTTSLYIDEGTKKKATARAKKDNLSFSAVVRVLLSEYAAGRIELGVREKYVVEHIPVDEEIQGMLDYAATLWHQKKYGSSTPAQHKKEGIKTRKSDRKRSA